MPSFIAASLEKSLQIILVRDVDGKTFWDALSDAISPRIAEPTTADETALSTLRSVFLDRPLKKGTFIFLTWLNPSRLLVSLFSVYISYELQNCSLNFFLKVVEIIDVDFLLHENLLWFQVSVSSHGFPSTVDATIESANVTSALFDVFLGDSPVSPSLKASVAEGLSKVLN